MTVRIITDSNGRKHITNEPLLHPPQRTWVGLTDEELYEIRFSQEINDTRIIHLFRKLEAKLKEKNETY